MIPPSISKTLPKIRSSLERLLTGRGGLMAFGSAARIFALGSQFVVLLIMSWMLPKAEFGDAMIVFTLYRLLSLGLGTGFGNLLLYHVARSEGDHDLDVRLLRTLTLWGFAVSGAITIAFAVSAVPIASLFDKPGMAPWLFHMSPIILFGTLTLTTAGSFDGRSRITESIVLTEVMPNALRLLGFPILAVLAMPTVSIAHVLWLALALPWLWDVRRLFNPLVSGLASLTFWDARYAALSAANPLLGQQLQGIDMLVVGALFSSTIAAEYSIASRLATLFPFLQQILARSFVPRVGALIAAKNIAAVNTELKALKSWSLILVALMSTVIIGPSFAYLPAFGDYSDSYLILIALAAPPFVRSMFSGIDVALRMTGRAGYGALISACSAGTIIFFSVLFHQSLGIYSVALSMMISAVSINVIATGFINRTGIIVADASALVSVTIALAGVAFALYLQNSVLSPAVCSILFLAAATITFLRVKKNGIQ